MTLSARRLLVGTAGHVDHGKTALIEALTGIDCDRWAEEKERGITIDLGFAHLIEGDIAIGFIDVPGHERFVHNALAGLGGLDLMMLVVDAGEGVKPQTREHIAICDLLAVPEAIVALTKIDLADDDGVTLVAEEIRELLVPTRFAGAEIFPVSSRTGAGLGDLRAALLRRARPDRRGALERQPARLPIDRVFQKRGRGVVVTGTLAAGSITVGEELETVPGAQPARVREVQVQGHPRERAVAGERVALQLAGIDEGALERGTVLAPPRAIAASRRLLARVRWLADTPFALAGWSEARLFLGTGESPARVRALEPNPLPPGADGIVEIVAARPLAAVRGDRLVLRRLSPAATLGGGVVLDPAWRRPRLERRREIVAALSRGDGEAAVAWIALAAQRGLSASDLARRLGVVVPDAAALLLASTADGRAVALPCGNETRFFSARTIQQLARRAGAELKRLTTDQRFVDGLSRAELRQRLLPQANVDTADALLAAVASLGVLRFDGDRARLAVPGEGDDERQRADARLAASVVAAFDAAGLKPPSPGEVRQALVAKAQILEGLLVALIRKGSLVRLSSGLILSAKAVDQLEADLRATGWSSFSVAQFKERFDLTRKWAIPLLEQLDGRGVTRRFGEERRILPPRTPRPITGDPS